MAREITPPGPISISEPREKTIADYEAENARLRADIRRMEIIHDKRVEELIRANSAQVIRRREINAHRMVLLEAVAKARNQFRFYARSHRDKVIGFDNRLKALNPEHDVSNIIKLEEQIIDTSKKARVNDQLADEMDEAILWESEPGAMGKP